MSSLPQQTPYQPTAPLRQAVVITDIDMPFGSMVRFIVKWVIASIPALIILWVIMALIAGVLALLFGGVFYTLLRGPSGQHF